jgi:hypothetical protein
MLATDESGAFVPNALPMARCPANPRRRAVAAHGNRQDHQTGTKETTGTLVALTGDLLFGVEAGLILASAQ